ncbi:MAG: hypothetical protein ACYC1C_06415 [Chloroflexota bacterium]
MPTLKQAAMGNGWPCEVSSSGRWLRFAGSGLAVYVIEADDSAVYSVVRSGEEGLCDVSHYTVADDAVEAAVQRLAS